MGYLGPSPVDLGSAYLFCYAMLALSYVLYRFLGKYGVAFKRVYWFGWMCSFFGNIGSLSIVTWAFFERQGLKLEPPFGHICYILAFIILPSMTSLSLCVLTKGLKIIRATYTLIGAAFLLGTIILYFVTDSHYIAGGGKIPITDLVYANALCLGFLGATSELLKTIRKRDILS